MTHSYCPTPRIATVRSSPAALRGMIGGMGNRSKSDWAIIGLAALGIAIMAGTGIVETFRESRQLTTPDETAFARKVGFAGAGIAVLSIIGAVQWKLIDFFLAGIRWINRRDDPRHAKRPPDAP